VIYLLDTDHATTLQRGGAAGDRLRARIASHPVGAVHVSIISYEEQVRGRLAEVSRAQAIVRQQVVYQRLSETLDLYCKAPMLAFDDAAVAQFQRLWLTRLRVGTMDLKIAAIALANDAILLSRNRSDFERVPDLRIEDWCI
jgi:tRNA(fMet)-specific endonuclease VapC